MRRTIISLISLLLAGSAMAQTLPPRTTARMSVADAHRQAGEGRVTLVDVRTPEEWRETGVPASAHAITMHQDPKALVANLDRVLGADRTKPLAIICRTGNRTGRLQAELAKLGYVNVIDVAEGVAGSGAGPGWLKTGLPVRAGSAMSPIPVQKAP
jgi:rhodanese-related sulfurtransferase